MLDQNDVNSIYSDLLVLSKELEDIKKCLNNMAMALRPGVTNIPETYPWDDIEVKRAPSSFRNAARKVKRTNVPETGSDLPWDA